MSKYTSQVKTVCEELVTITNSSDISVTCLNTLMPYLQIYNEGTDHEYAKIVESTGASSVDCILGLTWEKIFGETPPDFYDPNHYPELCKKILKHYWMREIGFETVGLWKFYMQQKMSEILPYYNKLYLSAEIQFNPLFDVDYVTHHDLGDTEHRIDNQTTDHINADTIDTEIKQDDTANTTTDITDNNTRDLDSGADHTGNTHTDTSGIDKFSDTPQGSVNTPIFDRYLTNASTNEGQVTTSDTAHDEGTEHETADKVRHEETDYTAHKGLTDNKELHATKHMDDEKTGTTTKSQIFNENIQGKRGSMTYSKMIQEYRDIIINIDMMVVNEFKDLFMLLW